MNISDFFPHRLGANPARNRWSDSVRQCVHNCTGTLPSRQGRPRLCSRLPAEELGAVAAYDAAPLDYCGRSTSMCFHVSHLLPGDYQQ